MDFKLKNDASSSRERDARSVYAFWVMATVIISLKRYFAAKSRKPLMAKYKREHNHVFVNHHGDPLTAAGVSICFRPDR